MLAILTFLARIFSPVPLNLNGMQNNVIIAKKFFKHACYFEGSLIILAVILGWLCNTLPFAGLHFSESDLLVGLLGTLPLLIIFLALQHLPHPAIQEIRALLENTFGANLGPLHWTDLLILAGIAGFSEEVLFRGVLQPWLESIWNLTGGLILSNLIFALVHAVTPLYALLALLIGIYLGLSLDYQGERNLLIPIVIHSVYDFAAFMVILHNYRNRI